MKRRLNPILFLLFLSLLGILMIFNKSRNEQTYQEHLKMVKTAIPKAKPSVKVEEKDSDKNLSKEPQYVELKPIIDISGWQLPEQMDYDTVASHISAVIVRVYGGSRITIDNNAVHTTGLDKSYATHIREFQKRNIPVAVYAYALGASTKEMREEAREFYNAASKYNPTFYWVDIEEETMTDMNAGVKAFREELKKLGAEKIGIYIGTYFMEEQGISVEDFDAVWIPAYGSNTGYYDAAPQTDILYHLHQYTDQGWLPGFDYNVDLNQIAPTQDTLSTFEKLFNKKIE